MVCRRHQVASGQARRAAGGAAQGAHTRWRRRLRPAFAAAFAQACPNSSKASSAPMFEAVVGGHGEPRQQRGEQGRRGRHAARACPACRGCTAAGHAADRWTTPSPPERPTALASASPHSSFPSSGRPARRRLEGVQLQKVQRGAGVAAQRVAAAAPSAELLTARQGSWAGLAVGRPNKSSQCLGALLPPPLGTALRRSWR